MLPCAEIMIRHRGVEELPMRSCDSSGCYTSASAFRIHPRTGISVLCAPGMVLVPSAFGWGSSRCRCVISGRDHGDSRPLSRSSLFCRPPYNCMNLYTNYRRDEKKTSLWFLWHRCKIRPPTELPGHETNHKQIGYAHDTPRATNGPSWRGRDRKAESWWVWD